MERLDIIPRIYYVANVFHFVSNLSRWHFSCREFYNKFWLQETGQLTKQESNSLRKASILFKKYGLGDKYWGRVLLGQGDDAVWLKAKEFLKGDYSKFEDLFRIFEPRFRKLWVTDKILLEKWVDRLYQIRERLSPPGLISDLDILFGSKNRLGSVEVILLANAPNGSASGGANLVPGAITLELSRTPIENTRPVILVMWHEVVHSIWQSDGYWEMISGFTTETKIASPIKGIPLRVIVNEAIVGSLFPYGYLARKHFGFPSEEYFNRELSVRKVKNGNMKYWRDYSAYRLLPLVKEYIERRKSVDNNFLRQVMKLIEVLP